MQKVYQLFPNSAYKTGTNPIQAGVGTWIPPEEKDFFYLDETQGEEEIYLLASLQKIPELENRKDIDQGELQKITAPMGWKGVRKVDKAVKIKAMKGNHTLESTIQEFEAQGCFLHKIKFRHDK